MADGYEQPREVAGYIAEMCTEMREMASRAGFSFLAYLLSMVILQAGKRAHADRQDFRNVSRAQSND